MEQADLKRHVFISYSSQDLEKVKALVDFVETTGQKCWYSDRDLDKGKENWRELLMTALKQSDKVILYLTPNALKSGDVENEINNASSTRKNIIPYIAQETKISDAFMYLIRKYEWIIAYKMEEKSAKDILRKRLHENLNEKRDLFWKTLQTREYREFYCHSFL